MRNMEIAGLVLSPLKEVEAVSQDRRLTYFLKTVLFKNNYDMYF